MNDPILTKYRIAVRHIMSHQRLSYEELGKRIGTSRQQLHFLLNRSKNISLSTAVRIAKTLRTSIEELTK